MVSDPEVGKPPKTKALRHTRRHAFEALFVIRSMNGVDELLKNVVDRLHRSRLTLRGRKRQASANWLTLVAPAQFALLLLRSQFRAQRGHARQAHDANFGTA